VHVEEVVDAHRGTPFVGTRIVHIEVRFPEPLAIEFR
jgi:hypothetical protein